MIIAAFAWRLFTMACLLRFGIAAFAILIVWGIAGRSYRFRMAVVTLLVAASFSVFLGAFRRHPGGTEDRYLFEFMMGTGLIGGAGLSLVAVMCALVGISPQQLGKMSKRLVWVAAVYSVFAIGTAIVEAW